jgi:MFS family permease
VVVISSTNSEDKATFRWQYIALPAAFLILAIILAASFYPLISPEVAYHFQDGSPDRWLGRAAILAWTLVPQVFFALLAFGIVRTAILSTRYWPAESTLMNKVLLVMGNMLALPQVILVFAMLDIFLYNAYHIKLIPLWAIALIIMVLGGMVLSVFFIRTIRQVRRQQVKSLQE